MQRHFKLHPSRLFTALLLSFYLAALVSVWLLPLPVFAALLVSVALSYGAAVHLGRDAQVATAQSCVAFRLEEGNGVVLMLRNGTHLRGRVSADSLATPFLVILNVALDEARGRRSIRVLPDSMGHDSFRRLRVVLRWQDGGGQAAV